MFLRTLLCFFIMLVYLPAQTINHSAITFDNEIATYKGTKFTGTVIKYYDNKTETSIEYKNGLKNGAAYRYTDHGKIASKKFYKDGELEGEYIIYDPDGDIICRFYFKGGVPEGRQEYYNKDILTHVDVYKDGKLDKSISYID